MYWSSEFFKIKKCFIEMNHDKIVFTFIQAVIS